MTATMKTMEFTLARTIPAPAVEVFDAWLDPECACNRIRRREMTTTDLIDKADFRAPTLSRRLTRAVADGRRGVIIATADVAGSPERVFRALRTNEVESWWAMPGVYRQTDSS
jgi:uncharacterized protein YndB with AHSA1/START domain